MSTECSSPSGLTLIWRRLIVARTYAIDGGGEYSGVFTAFMLLAITLTVWAAMLGVRAWRRRMWPLSAAVVSVLAALSILWVAVAINLRG